MSTFQLVWLSGWCALVWSAAAVAALEPHEPHAVPTTHNAPADAPEVPLILPLDAASIEKKGVEIAVEGTGPDTRLRFKSRHDQEWPGLTVKAPNGRWDWGQYEYVAIDVKNTGATRMDVALRVDNQGGNGADNSVTSRISLEPGRRDTLKVLWTRKTSNPANIKLFGMRGYPAGLGEADKSALDPAQITQMILFVPKPTQDHTFEASNFRVGGRYIAPAPVPVENFFPLIDTFGQYKHRDWPGKVHSMDELRGRVASENTELLQKPGPDNWNQYGGWKNGPSLQATGFFRTTKHNGKWWLVDPEGKLFFSHGITGVRPGNSTPIDDRANWFENFPGDQPAMKAFFETANHVVRGYYKGRPAVRAFNFSNANLQRKYGAAWRQRYAEVAHRRLRSWGLNTIANWSDPAVYEMRRTPYVVAISFTSKLLEGSEGYWGQFRDVFDADFPDKLRARMEQERSKSAGDAWCIGYFVDNEISWGDEVSLAIAALRSPATQTAKQVFIHDLKVQHGTIEKLNAAWNTSYASWDALLDARTAPDAKDARVRADLIAFYRKTASKYFATVREAVKAVAPKQLYLGVRFAWVNPVAAEVATRYCDVVSYNLYRTGVDGFQPPADVPLIIGEFHFGALDRGMFHTGLQQTRNQNDRAEKYRQYVQSVLRHPNFVGCHWFQYMDQPATGRALDEENYQIGFVDGADTPYPETIAAARQVGYDMYRYRTGGK